MRNQLLRERPELVSLVLWYLAMGHDVDVRLWDVSLWNAVVKYCQQVASSSSRDFAGAAAGGRGRRQRPRMCDVPGNRTEHGTLVVRSSSEAQHIVGPAPSASAAACQELCQLALAS